MAFTQSNDASLYWDEAGQGTPILLIMGHRYSSRLWYPVMPALTAAHRVIRFDNRGTGESPTTRDLSVAQMTADALAVMDAAKVERAHVFGVSMGGVLALDLALRHPERVTSLMLGCTGILSAEKPRMPAFMRVLYYLPRGVLRLLLSSRRGDAGYGSAATPERIAADQAVLEVDKSTVPGVLAQAKAMAAYSTTKEAVAKLTMPALVLHGTEDKVVRFDWGVELAQTLPNARFVKLEGAGHNFFIAAGDAANTAVLAFMREVDAKG